MDDLERITIQLANKFFLWYSRKQSITKDVNGKVYLLYLFKHFKIQKFHFLDNQLDATIQENLKQIV